MKESAQFRREFLKLVAAGIAGAAAGCATSPNGTPSTPSDPTPPPTTSFVWQDRTTIHPLIDNRRVVNIVDPAMMSSQQSGTFAVQNSNIDSARVSANMDLLAVQLAQTASAPEAWASLFQKPEAKAWSDVVVAIKVNCLYDGLMAHVAIIGKVCNELIALGVLPSNISIFDSVHPTPAYYGSYVGNGLAAGVTLPTVSRDGIEIPVGTETLLCTSVIARKDGDGKIVYVPDLVINIPVNKGHLKAFGGFTMAMKNHVGTMYCSGIAICPPFARLIAMNKSEALLGGTPARQQLIIVDSLWAAKDGPSSPITGSPACISMGIFAPITDYLVAKKVREQRMNVTSHDATLLSRMVTEFGYAEAELADYWTEVVAPA